MTVPARKPADETRRLETLRRYALLDTPAEESFDRVVRLAARHFNVPVALVSLVDENRQWFKARCGLDTQQTERDVAFCSYAILQDDVFVIPNALDDSRFRDNPLVTGDPKIRFYAGAPLKAVDGQNVGTLCLIDDKPHPPLTDQEKNFLADLAAIVVDEFEMRAASGVVMAEVETRIAAEDRLASTEQQLRLFIEYAPAAIAMFDRDMTYIAVSRRWRSDYGLDTEVIVGRSHYELFPDVPERWKEDHCRCLAGEVLSCEEDLFERADGSSVWLRWELHPWQGRAGQVGGLIMFTEVITERKRAADELERSSEFLNVVLDNVQDGVVACDAEGRLLLFNSASRRFHGLDERPIPPEEWADHYDLFEADGETPLKKESIPLFRALQGEAVRNAELVIAPKSLPRRYLISSGQPLFSKDGRKLGAVASMHDVTERKQMEEQYRQAQKMEAVGQLTGGLAHDFNNLLAVILGNLQLLQRAVKDDEKSARRAAAAADAAQRGAELTKRLLAFSRKQALEPKLICANDLITGMEDLLHRTLGQTIEFAIALDDDLWTVRVDETQLEAAILNLSINARDAMEDGGRLTIETRNMSLDDDDAACNADLPAGDYAVIAVTDTGCGIPQEALAKIFEPFFTTKDVGKGSGLGLSMVYGFIKQSGGLVRAYSELEHGTTFTMYLPRDRDADATEQPADTDAGACDSGCERILVVEDNDAVREVAVSMLEEMGYDIAEAENGHVALQRLEAEGHRFDLLFTDIVMPGGINGPALARMATEQFPALKVLYTSGYAEAAVLREGDIRNGAELVSKPFRQEELARKVRQVLDGPVGASSLDAVGR